MTQRLDTEASLSLAWMASMIGKSSLVVCLTPLCWRYGTSYQPLRPDAENDVKPISILGFAVTATFVTTVLAGPVQLVTASKSEFEGAVYSGHTTEIEPPVAGLDQYRVFQQAATGFTSLQTTRVAANRSATEFCARKAKSVHAVSETASTPPHILGNFPRIELIFQCVDTVTNPSTVVEGNRYEKIATLKKLLDSGALTQQEFDAEKAKILAAP